MDGSETSPQIYSDFRCEILPIAEKNFDVLMLSTGMVNIPPNKGGAVESIIWDTVKMLDEVQYVNRIKVVSNYNIGNVEKEGLHKVVFIPSHSPFNRFPLPPLRSTIAHLVGGFLTAISALRQLSQNRDSNLPLIVHCHEEISGLLMNLFEKKAILVLTLHNPHPSWNVNLKGSEKLFRRLDAKISFDFLPRKYAAIISQNEYIKEFLVSRGIEERKIFVVESPIDTQFFSPSTNEHSSQKITKNLIFVGRLERRKNIFDLLNAMLLLPKDTTLSIVGDGPERKRIISFLEQEKLKDRVVLYENVSKDELLNLYRNSNLFILPSLLELHPRSISEALSVGLPILLPKSRIFEHFKKKGVALLYDLGDPSSLANVINEFFKNTELQESESRNARKYAIDNLSYTAISNKLTNVYLKVVR
jgi:glycosyltransferase involved in cell wall biosynthesis